VYGPPAHSCSDERVRVPRACVAGLLLLLVLALQLPVQRVRDAGGRQREVSAHHIHKHVWVEGQRSVAEWPGWWPGGCASEVVVV